MRNLKINKGDSRQTRKSKQRAYNNIKRKDKVYDDGQAHFTRTRNGQYHATKKGPIKYSLSIERFYQKNAVLARQSNKFLLKLNKDFSLFNNPGKVLLSLVEIVKHGKIRQVSPTIVYDGHVSFGAIYLLDNLSYEIQRQRKWVLKSLQFPPEELSILSNIRSFASSHYEDENECMINEKVAINRVNNPAANQQYKTKAKDITDMIQTAIQETLKKPEYELPLEIHGAIKSTIGEQFDNIHLHSEETQFGTLCGFYNKMSKEITILIYNFGKTIAETLVTDDLPDEMLDDITKVITSLTTKKILNLTVNSEFTLENAVTLLALQEGISSRLKFDISRGHGMMDFIQQCLELSIDSKISIISGKTAIKIDKTYPISRRNVLGRERRVLALNKENDIFSKPDPNYIVNTGVYFNGVIIETTIPLNDFSHE